MLARRHEVKEIIVVELEQDVINLVKDSLPRTKVTVVRADLME